MPSYTAQVIRSLLAAQSAAPEDAPLFCTRNGTFISPHNLRRQLRAVLADGGLPEGVELSVITPHTFRKTVATTINRAASSDLAAELLGHTSRGITEAFYIQPTKRVNPVTAYIQCSEATCPKSEACPRPLERALTGKWRVHD